MINKPIIPVPRNISEGTLTIESRGNISATPGRQNVKRLHRSGGAFQTHSSDPAYDSSDMSLDSEKSFKSRLLEFYQGQGIASNGIKFDLTTSGTRGFIVFHCKLSLPPTAFLQDQVSLSTICRRSSLHPRHAIQEQSGSYKWRFAGSVWHRKKQESS